MALIIELTTDADTSEDRPGQRHGGSVRPVRQGSAEVIIFPGVRYERWDDNGAPDLGNAQAVTDAAERDWLEL